MRTLFRALASILAALAALYLGVGWGFDLAKWAPHVLCPVPKDIDLCALLGGIAFLVSGVGTYVSL